MAFRIQYLRTLLIQVRIPAFSEIDQNPGEDDNHQGKSAEVDGSDPAESIVFGEGAALVFHDRVCTRVAVEEIDWLTRATDSICFHVAVERKE